MMLSPSSRLSARGRLCSRQECRTLQTPGVMRDLTLSEVLDLYYLIMEQSGGTVGIHDLGGLESALAQPRMTFDGQEL